MYLHVGNNQNIRIKDIVGLFDADTATVSAIKKKYIKSADASGRVRFASEELPKSFVLYWERKSDQYCICFSQLSTASLCGRVEQFGGFEK